jgi:hypothetical protein
VVRSGARRNWNGIHYKHIHVGFELILYILKGKVRHEFLGAP